jgi:hypothetical protein
MNFKKINTRESETANNKSTPLVWCNGVCSCKCICAGGVKVAKAASGWGNNAIVNASKALTCW